MNKRHYIMILVLFTLVACEETTRSVNQNGLTPPMPEFKIIKDTFQYFSLIDTAIDRYKLPLNFKKPGKWLEAEANRKEKFGDWYGGAYPDSFDLKDALALIDTATNLSFASAKSWCMKNYQQAFPYLVARLSDKRKLGISDAGDLIIWDRVNTGDLESYGHGSIIEEDVFTIAGRASWILNELTGESFAIIHGNTTQQETEQFKKDWAEYIKNFNQ